MSVSLKDMIEALAEHEVESMDFDTLYETAYDKVVSEYMEMDAEDITSLYAEVVNGRQKIVYQKGVAKSVQLGVLNTPDFRLLNIADEEEE